MAMWGRVRNRLRYLRQHALAIANLRRIDAADIADFLDTDAQEVVTLAVDATRLATSHIPGILSIHWGARTKRGRRTNYDGVVIIVARKQNVPRGLRLPRHVVVRRGSVRVRISIDVRELARGTLQLGAIRYGFHARMSADTRTGTLSGTTVAADGKVYAIISRHVAGKAGALVKASTSSGTELSLGSVTHMLHGSELDSALVGPVSAEHALLLGELVNGVRHHGTLLTSTSVRIVLAREGSVASARVDAVGEPVALRDPHTGEWMHFTETIRLSAAVTIGGDSGAPALDDADNLVGFVIGAADGRTYVASAWSTRDAIQQVV